MFETKGSSHKRLFLVALVTVIVLSLSGCYSPEYGPEEERITLAIASPFVEPRNTGTAMLHDATLDIMKITPKDSTVKWSNVKVLIKGADGSVLLPATPVIVEDTGTYGGTVEVWYHDEAGDRKKVDAGDSILITGMEAAEYEGAWVEITRLGERIGAVSLPTDFP